MTTTVTLTQAIFIGGVRKNAGTTITVDDAFAGALISENKAARPEDFGKDFKQDAQMIVDNNNNLTGLVNPKTGGLIYSLLQNQRNENIANFNKGVMIVAPPWTANQTVASGDVRRLSNGKHIVCVTGGACAATEPRLNGVSSITGDVSGTTLLTVTAVQGGPIGVGTELTSGGTTAGTRISALGTGAGGAGTYTLTGNSVATSASVARGAVTNPPGRLITDNAATWYEDFNVKATSDPDAPVVTWVQGASAAVVRTGLGMTANNLTAGSYALGETARFLTPKCGVATIHPSFVATGFDYRKTSGINVNYDTTAAAYGYPVGMQKSTAFEFESIITDTAFGLELGNGAGLNYQVTIDGRPVEGFPTRTSATNGNILLYDFKGKYKRRKVLHRAPTATSAVESRISVINLTALGTVENGEKSNDTLLMIGDSQLESIGIPTLTNGQGIFHSLGLIVKNGLGFDGCVAAAAGGSGYLATNGNFTARQMIEDPTNQNLFSSYNVNHIMICHGFNDGAQIPSAVAAEAILAWQATRRLFPTKNITVCSPWFTDAAGNIAVAAAIKEAFNTWGDSNSRYLDFNGIAGNKSLIFGAQAANIGTLVYSTANGSRALAVGTDGTHFSLAGVRIVSDFMISETKRLWNNQY